MKRNEVPDVESWNLHQLARVLTKNPKDARKILSTIQEACSLSESIEKQADQIQLAQKRWRCTKESLQVAIIAATEMDLDLSAVIAAILSPPYLAGLIKKGEVEKRFDSKTVSILVELSNLRSCRIEHDTICNYPSHPDITSPHILAILLQICDIIQVHCSGAILESQDLEQTHSSFQLLLELKYFYIPLSHRIRLYDIQTKLADFWLKHSDTLSYYSITAKIGMTKLQRKQKLDLLSEEIYATLKGHGISFTMKKRIKSVYSIWNKIHKLKVDFDQIHDLAAVRIIITGMDGKTLAEEKIACWKVFSIISELYKPMYNVMRDWVSTPRDTGYESLHLTFETNKYGRLEVQIRTERMDYIAEHGDAAHWKYKRNSL